MRLYNFRKEQAIWSDSVNWASQELNKMEGFYFDGIEGCSQNTKNQTTHLFERAHVDIEEGGKKSKEDVLSQIIELEGGAKLQRKINFAKILGLPLHYVLYNDEREFVFLLEFHNIMNVEIIRSFSSYAYFGKYLSEVKGWESNKEYKEYEGLPEIDKALRRSKATWPMNIECFCSDKNGYPLAIVEFQNAKEVGVFDHDNNSYFLCKRKFKKKTEYGHKIQYHDDIRRWKSQEILRVQTGLPLLNITWSERESHSKFQEIEQIIFPDFETYENDVPWKKILEYKAAMHEYTIDPNPENYLNVCKRRTMSFFNINGRVQEVFHNPHVSLEQKTFPSIYWKHQFVQENDKSELKRIFYLWSKNQTS